MFDVKAIRDDRAVFDRGWTSRGLTPLPTDDILKADEKLRAAKGAFEAAQARRNEASKLIGAAKKAGDEARAAELMAEVEALKSKLAGLPEAEKEDAGRASRPPLRPPQPPRRGRTARRRRALATRSGRRRLGRSRERSPPVGWPRRRTMWSSASGWA